LRRAFLFGSKYLLKLVSGQTPHCLGTSFKEGWQFAACRLIRVPFHATNSDIMHQIAVDGAHTEENRAGIDPTLPLFVVTVDTDTLSAKAIQKAQNPAENVRVDLSETETIVFESGSALCSRLNARDIPAGNVVGLVSADSGKNKMFSHLLPIAKSKVPGWADTATAFWRVRVYPRCNSNSQLENVMQQIVSDYRPERICDIADAKQRSQRAWPWGDPCQRGPWPLYQEEVSEKPPDQLDDILI